MLELAGGGLSNPEIAQQLFITRKTVETHLGHVYSKLDIASRAQLPEAIRRGSCRPQYRSGLVDDQRAAGFGEDAV